MKTPKFAIPLIIALIACSCSPAPTPRPPTYLSEFEPQTAKVGWGMFSIGRYQFTSSDPTDKIKEGDPIVMHEVEYPHGLYAHAPSQLVYDLGGNFSELQVTIGMVDWIKCGDGAQFIILLDGIETYRSPTMLASSPPIDVKVSIANGQNLELLTDHGSAKDWHCDWTIWGDPVLR